MQRICNCHTASDFVKSVKIQSAYFANCAAAAPINTIRVEQVSQPKLTGGAGANQASLEGRFAVII
jgi:hypothetical protein